MKIIFLGDSITAGSCASSLEKNYVSQVGQMLGCEVVNCGIGGTRIARQTKNSTYHEQDIDFNMRTILLDKTADKVFVFGGTNDYGHGDAKFGDKGDTDVYTFHGAVNTLYSTLIGMYGKENVIVILPMKRSDMYGMVNSVTGKRLIDYVEVIKYYVNLYGLKYLDFYNNCLPEPPEGESEFFADGLHPNDKGYKVLAEKICEFIKNDK